jgi:hypothetical protein
VNGPTARGASGPTLTEKHHARNLLYAVADSLSLATKSELGIEAKMKSETVRHSKRLSQRT